jgi:signal transduction histidine kinase
MQDQVDDKEHKLIINLPADLPPAYADPARVMQVWTNLLSNAIKYTPRGGRIQIRANRHDSDREAADTQWILCAVEDNGIGIAAKDQDRVFEQFYRVRNPQTNEEPGTGLGLSITQSIVELHGGHIWFESAPGKGSTFYFTLPVSQPDPQGLPS